MSVFLGEDNKHKCLHCSLNTPKFFGEKKVKISALALPLSKTLTFFSRMYKPLHMSLGVKSTTVTPQVPMSYVFIEGR